MFGAGGLLAGLADETDRFVKERFERIAVTAREKTEEFAEHAGERFARHLVDQLVERLASRLAWAAAAAAALAVALWLIVAGLAGALGEAFGREWLGQLAAGAITLIIAFGSLAVVRSRKRRRAEGAKTTAALEAARVATAPSSESRDDGEEGATGDVGDLADTLGRQALEAGAKLVRRHPVASAAAISAAGLLAGTLLARSNGKSRSH
ncbi:MAG TPA: hypothetical protein VK824_03385 [Planctomycetota bacterium]|nr:hypothetical protein [Planctomycetota bacterium]